MCFESTNTEVAMELALFPLSFKLSMTRLTSLELIGVRKKDWLALFFKYEEALFWDGGIFYVNWLAMLV